MDLPPDPAKPNSGGNNPSDAEPPATVTDSRANSTQPEDVGTVIGRYKVLQPLGEGGFGIVYVAEQQEPVRRRVALKVIKPGMDSKAVIARFEAERQALALMDHPGIAKVFDAGVTAAGRPYFVMEWVKGIRITDYCDQNRLSPRERLNLFMQVCHAIQHAHQKGIIHRDIKPSNILVTQQDGIATPKVIDFGIAKATGGQTLTDKTLFTAFEQFLGTPAYMSPEQAQVGALDMDTRSDIYSLGVLLYELLTGKTPFDHKRLFEAGLDEIRRIIREEEPPRPSTRFNTLTADEQTTVAKRRQSDPPQLAHLVKGDLDWIAMRCLEKDQNRRYATANGLAADIERYLNNEPVLARPPSSLYRIQKLYRRNKLVVTATGAIMLALTFGLVVATWLLARERQALRKADVATQATEEALKREAVMRREAETNLVVARNERRLARLALADQLLERADLMGAKWRWPDAQKSVNEARAILQESGGPTLGADLTELEVLRHASPPLGVLGSGTVASACAISPDGLLAAIAVSGRLGSNGDNAVYRSKNPQMPVEIWHLPTLQKIATLSGFTQEVNQVLFFGSNFVAGALPHGKTIVWNWRTGQALYTNEGNTLLLAACGEGQRLFIAQSAYVPKPPPETINSSFSGPFLRDTRDEERSSTTIWRMDLDKLGVVSSNKVIEFPGAITDMAASEDGSRLLLALPSFYFQSAGGTSYTGVKQPELALVSGETGQRFQNFSGPSQLRLKSVAISRDGSLGLTCSHDTIVLWDLNARVELRRFHTDIPDDLDSVAFSVYGREFAAYHSCGVVSVWSLESSKLAHATQVGLPYWGRRICFSSDLGFAITTSPFGAATIWKLGERHDLHDLAYKRAIPGGYSSSTIRPNHIAFTEDERLATVQGGRFIAGTDTGIVDTDSGLLFGAFAVGENPLIVDSSMVASYFLSGSNQVSLTTQSRSRHEYASIFLRDLSAGKESQLWSLTNDLSLGERTVAVLSPDGRMAAVQLPSRTEPAFASTLRGLTPTNLGYQITLLTVTNPPSARVLFCPAHSLEGRPTMAFVPGSTVLATSSHADGNRRHPVTESTNIIRIWDVGSLQLMKQTSIPLGHGSFVGPFPLSASVGGKLLVCGNGNVRVLEARDLQELARLPAGTIPESMFFCGSNCIAICDQREIKFWDWRNTRLLKTLPRSDHDLAVNPFNETRFLLGGWDGHLNDRFREFRKSLDAPGGADDYALLGKWYAFRQMWDWADEAFSRARAAGKEYSHLDAGRVHFKREEYQEAGREFEKALQANEAPASYLRLLVKFTERAETNVVKVEQAPVIPVSLVKTNTQTNLENGRVLTADSTQEILDSVGDTVRIRGLVRNASYSGTGSILFISFDRNKRDKDFMAIMKRENLPAIRKVFGEDLIAAFNDRQLEISGKVFLYTNRTGAVYPEIDLEKPEQINIIGLK